MRPTEPHSGGGDKPQESPRQTGFFFVRQMGPKRPVLTAFPFIRAKKCPHKAGINPFFGMEETAAIVSDSCCVATKNMQNFVNGAFEGRVGLHFQHFSVIFRSLIQLSSHRNAAVAHYYSLLIAQLWNVP